MTSTLCCLHGSAIVASHRLRASSSSSSTSSSRETSFYLNNNNNNNNNNNSSSRSGSSLGSARKNRQRGCNERGASTKAYGNSRDNANPLRSINDPNFADLSDRLKLDNVRQSLIRQEDSILSLIHI